jgi:HSP20 family protein
MNLMRRKDAWKPFDLMRDLQDDMNQVFNRSFASRLGNGLLATDFSPVLEVQEEADRFIVHADLPGMKKDDIDISVAGNVLTLTGERKHEKETKDKSGYYTERTYGAFSRALELSVEVEASQVKATYNDGVLEITLPKSERAKPKKISVDIN